MRISISTIRSFLSRGKIFIHPIRSYRFIKALMLDKRVHIGRKILFTLLVAGLGALLFYPDLAETSILSFLLPILGTLLGIPLGAGFDWAAFAFASVHLLSVFPAHIVKEHYATHFGDSTPAIPKN